MAVTSMAAPATPTPPTAAPPRPTATAAPAPSAENAATLYNQAFALLPQDRDNPDLKAIAEAPDGPVDAAMAALIRKYDRTAQLIRQAAAAPKCDWGLPRGQGPELIIPYLNPARTTANLIWLRARYESQQKQPAQAFEDLAALFVLSRRVRTDPYVICVLVGYGIQEGTVHTAAEALPQAPPDVLTKFDRQLAALPGGSSMLEGWMGEVASQVEWLRGLENTDAATLFAPDGKLAKLLAMDRTKRPANFPAAFREQWENPQSRAAGIAEVQSTTAAAAPVFTVPADQGGQTEAAWERTVQSAGPLAQLLSAQPGRLRFQSDMAAVRLAMLRAAVQVRLHGPESLKAIRDPAGSGPFAYRATPKGFELTSKMQVKDKPVTLTVGPEQ
jgi:hypothetical protein